MAAQEPASTKPRRRRIALIVAAAALVLLVLALRWVSQPSYVARLILSQAGSALGLEITASGANEYRLRGTPLLEVRDVVARQPGTTTPVLRAERILLEVPWKTVRALGDDLTVRHVELDAPQLDLAALQRWQATRPPSETKIPTLTDGLRIVRGRVIGDGWSVDALDVDVPVLYANRAVNAKARGRFISGTTRVPFDLRAALTRPAARAGLGLHGTVEVQSPPWSLPMVLTASGRLHNATDGIGLDALKASANARYRNAATDLPFALGLAGPLRVHEGELRIAPLGLSVRGNDVIPTLDSRGTFAFGDALAVQLEGTMTQWPPGWPALPAPLDRATSPLPIALDYRGRADLSDVAALRVQRDDAQFGSTQFDGRFRLPAVLAWIDADASGSPLPPLDGRLTTPRLEIAGATLQGVEIELSDDRTTTVQ